MGVRVARVTGFGSDRVAAEGTLANHGIVLPLPQRGEFLKADGCSASVLHIVSNDANAPCAAAGVGITPTRALPGHRLGYVYRLGATAEAEADAALVKSLAEAARTDMRCVRMTVEVFERDASRRSRLADALSAAGFTKAVRQRTYARTLALDLSAPEPELFAALSASVRRNIRQPVKRGLELRRIDDPALAPRLAALMQQVFQRTGSAPPALPWQSIVALSTREPHVSHLVGLFDPKTAGPETLIAFVWGYALGDYVVYEAGAAERRPDLGNISLGSAPLWDLIAWACETTSATWFDFGGVTATGVAMTDDPLQGISTFKRSFCTNVVEVGEQWVLEPRPIRAAIIRVISDAARAVRQ